MIALRVKSPVILVKAPLHCLVYAPPWSRRTTPIREVSSKPTTPTACVDDNHAINFLIPIALRGRAAPGERQVVLWT